MDPELLNKALKFDRTPINGIPGFNSSDLAINDQQTLMRGDDMGEDEHGKKIKRKKKIQNGADPKDNIYNVVVFCSYLIALHTI